MDLVIFLFVMFLVRVIHIESLGFWVNALSGTLITVGVATGLLHYRRRSWRDLGLNNPGKVVRLLAVTAITLIATVGSIMIFELFLRDLFTDKQDEASSLARELGDIKGNYGYFFSILPFIWLESFLEELQDRGFSLNRFESLFSRLPVATMLAVLCQAAIFGFRHSYDFSPRSLTTGLIGLILGIVYVLSGRNLWPLIIAHIIMNTFSMIGRL